MPRPLTMPTSPRSEVSFSLAKLAEEHAAQTSEATESPSAADLEEESSIRPNPIISRPFTSHRRSSVTHMITAPQMTDAEHNLARLIKLCCLVIITSAVIYLAMDRLEAILIPLMIAVAFSYLLTPLIDAFSCRHIEGYPAAFRLPRGLAVLLSFGVAVAILLSLGLIILQALSTFRARSSLYRARMEEVLAGLFEAAKELNERMGVNGPHSFEGGPNRGGTALEEASDMVKAFMKDISITDLILHLLGTAAHVAEDLMYIILFLVFMLMHTPNETPDGNSRHTVSAKVERQIFVYIRGKASISGFVGGCHAAVLWFVGLELWLPFGVVTFFLNFIPNVGGLAAVMLPMPLVALDPAFGPSGVATALLVVRRIHTLSLTLSALLMLTPSSLALSSLAPHSPYSSTSSPKMCWNRGSSATRRASSRSQCYWRSSSMALYGASRAWSWRSH